MAWRLYRNWLGGHTRAPGVTQGICPSPQAPSLPPFVLIVVFIVRPLKEDHHGCILQCLGSFTRHPRGVPMRPTGPLSAAGVFLILAGPTTCIPQSCPSTGLRIRKYPCRWFSSSCRTCTHDLLPSLAQPAKRRSTTAALSHWGGGPHRPLFPARHEESPAPRDCHPFMTHQPQLRHAALWRVSEASASGHIG